MLESGKKSQEMENPVAGKRGPGPGVKTKKVKNPQLERMRKQLNKNLVKSKG